MRLLLDTHVILWLANEPEKIPAAVRSAIAGADVVYVSVATAWEYGIKRLKQPDRLPLPFGALVSADMQTLNLDFDCHTYAESLPAIHSDPFDRMLIAQALHHDLALVTGDRMIMRYPVSTFWRQ